MKYVSVILDDNLEKPLDYSVPSTLENNLLPGMRVEVPLKNSFKKGFILDIKTFPNFNKVKPVKAILSDILITKDLFLLALWMSKYYASSLSSILRCIVPSSIKKEIKPKKIIFLSLAQSKKKTVSICAELILKHPNQAYVLELFLKKEKGFFLSDLVKLINSSKSPIDTLIKKKYLKSEKLIKDEKEFLLSCDYFKTKNKKLNEDQQKAFEKICSSLEKSIFETHLLFGITGSGKTEVYLQAIQKALEEDKSVIMLLPEIALTTQTIERFKSRFDEKIAILHHRRSQGEKFDAWHKILKGEIKIVIGARSAIFAPLKNLGLIIVDEEHDYSYKQQEEMPTYNAKNVAVMRGKFASATVILGSATPSFESFYNAQNSKYNLSMLLSRPNSANLPIVHIIDMKRELEKNKGFTHFSDKLLDGIKKRYEKGEQTILFLNRRGYHNFLRCSDCSFVIKCLHCDISLTFHKNQNLLHCHSCGYNTTPPKICPSCKNHGQLEYKGFGTEHVEASLKAILKDVKTLRIDRDTTAQKYSHETLLKQFRSGKADVLIGTQMVVKGLHFPSVSLVGILNTDGALNIPDFRSSETIFSLITQVSGRAGRCNIKGEVIIQSFMPKNPTIEKGSKQDFLSFYTSEIENRKLFNYPPFCNMIKVVFSSPDELLTKNSIGSFRALLIQKLPKDVQIHPALPAAIAKQKDLFRFQFLLRSNKLFSLSQTIYKLKNSFKRPSCIKIMIDVDPITTYF